MSPCSPGLGCRPSGPWLPAQAWALTGLDVKVWLAGPTCAGEPVAPITSRLGMPPQDLAGPGCLPCVRQAGEHAQRQGGPGPSRFLQQQFQPSATCRQLQAGWEPWQLAVAQTLWACSGLPACLPQAVAGLNKGRRPEQPPAATAPSQPPLDGRWRQGQKRRHREVPACFWLLTTCPRLLRGHDMQSHVRARAERANEPRLWLLARAAWALA